MSNVPIWLWIIVVLLAGSVSWILNLLWNKWLSLLTQEEKQMLKMASDRIQYDHLNNTGWNQRKCRNDLSVLRRLTAKGYLREDVKDQHHYIYWRA